jgi:hypothetical protein
MELNFRRRFVAPAGSAVFTVVTASPTAAERVPRPPWTTTRNVVLGWAVASSSRLCGTVGTLRSSAPATAEVAAVPADASGTAIARTTMLASATAHGRNCLLGRPPI